MRSEELDLQRYDTDKIRNGYLRWYDAAIGDAWSRVGAVLELGVHHGGSLELWRDYFPAARIAGVDADISGARIHDQTRIELFQGQQNDATFLHGVARRVAPEGFDVIIDDASHLAKPSEASFRALYDAHLKKDGWYVIEDWATGYLPDWPDGRKPSRWRTRSHEAGMVGWIKRLIDDEVRGRLAEMTITPGVVVIRKGC
jgi:spermidine synthase